MRILVAALLLVPAIVAPAGGNFHEPILTRVPDRDYVLVMRGVGFNGLSHPDTPLLEAFAGEVVRFTVIVPPLAEPHTFHLHGHPWRLDDGTLIDTILLKPGETHSFLVVAGGPDRNSGDWMYHCHFDTHAAGGMWGIFRVYPFAMTVTGGGEGYRLEFDAPVDSVRVLVAGAPVEAHAALTERGALVHLAEPPTGPVAFEATGPLGVSVARTGPPSETHAHDVSPASLTNR